MIFAYAVAGAAIGSLATWLILAYSSLLIWGTFIGWAGFLHSGGDKTTIKSTLLCMYFGALLAWIFSFILIDGHIALSLPILAGLLVAIVVPVIVFASQFSLLRIAPACFYGFASSFAFLTQTPGKFTNAAMLSMSLDNVIIVVPVSMTIGVCLGYLQTVVASRLMPVRAQQT